MMIHMHQYVRQQEPGEANDPRGPGPSEGSLNEKHAVKRAATHHARRASVTADYTSITHR